MKRNGAFKGDLDKNVMRDIKWECKFGKGNLFFKEGFTATLYYGKATAEIMCPWDGKDHMFSFTDAISKYSVFVINKEKNIYGIWREIYKLVDRSEKIKRLEAYTYKVKLDRLVNIIYPNRKKLEEYFPKTMKRVHLGTTRPEFICELQKNNEFPINLERTLELCRFLKYGEVVNPHWNLDNLYAEFDGTPIADTRLFA